MVEDEYIFEAFRLCLRHKSSSMSAIKYRWGYEEDLLRLTDEINERTYSPSVSTAFVVTVPKYREVFAACFRDRIVHHYVIMRLEPLFEEVFGDRTFNCRTGKGTLYGINTLKQDIYDCSEGYTKDCWIMKMDLRGFFMSIDKQLLDTMLQKFIEERYFGDDKEDIMWLTHVIVMHEPEKNCRKRSPDKLWDYLPPNKSLFTNGKGLGMPIGNLSSQHFANFLLSHLDKFIESLGFKYHGRYVDDFYIVGTDRKKMLCAVENIRSYLRDSLHVELHKDKFYFQHYSKGVSFTGSIVKYGRIYPGKRLVANFYSSIYKLGFMNTPAQVDNALCSVNSYLGLMKHFNSYAIRRKGFCKLSKDGWGHIYVKKKFLVAKQRKNWKKVKIPESEYLRVYYMKDPLKLDDKIWGNSCAHVVKPKTDILPTLCDDLPF